VYVFAFWETGDELRSGEEELNLFFGEVSIAFVDVVRAEIAGYISILKCRNFSPDLIQSVLHISGLVEVARKFREEDDGVVLLVAWVEKKVRLF
jgi:hypothetical protein